jgi:pyoluteorin transport system permease protein
VIAVSEELRIEHRDSLRARARRIWALVRKESQQVIHDPSSIGVGIVLPVLLILLFGYGLSLDIKNVPVALVLEDRSPDAVDLASVFFLSPYFKVGIVSTMTQAQDLMLTRNVDGIVRIRRDFSRLAKTGQGEVQILLHGSDANLARIIQGYAEGAVAQWTARQRAEGKPTAVGLVQVRERAWFNETNESRFFLVPGLMVMIMTISGALLTAMVMAREWERGTLEALFVTPVRAGEILLGKIIPYFALGLLGFVFCTVAAKFLFHLPFRGSILVLTAVSILYLTVSLGLGLLISSGLKSQFLASLVTLILAFLPSLMLSGFLFDIRSEPIVVQFITYLFPARYYVSVLQTLLLAGNIWSDVLPNAAVLLVMAVALMLANFRFTRKSLV